jgi:hypothetical protein
VRTMNLYPDQSEDRSGFNDLTGKDFPAIFSPLKLILLPGCFLQPENRAEEKINTAIMYLFTIFSFYLSDIENFNTIRGNSNGLNLS